MDIWRQAIAKSIHEFGLDYYGITPNILIFLSLSTVIVSILSLILIHRIVGLQKKILQQDNSTTTKQQQHITLFEYRKLEKLDTILKFSDLNEKKGKILKKSSSNSSDQEASAAYFDELRKCQEMLIKESRYEVVSSKEQNLDELKVFWSIGAQNTKLSIQKSMMTVVMNQATVISNRKDRNHDFESTMREQDLKSYGNECLEQRSISMLNYPIKKYFDHCIVSERVDFPFSKTKSSSSHHHQHYNYTESIISYCDELLEKKVSEFMRANNTSGNSNGSKQCLFMALPFYLYQDVTLKEKLIHYAFDTWNYEKVHLSLEHLLPIFSVGKTSGLTIDFGELLTTVVPIYEGMSVWNSISAIPFGGHSVEEVLQAMLLKNQCLDTVNLKFASSSEREILRSIKEKLCYTKSDCLSNSSSGSRRSDSSSTMFNLPDGNILRIPIESENILHDCTEYYFDMSIDRQYYESWSAKRSVQNCVLESLNTMDEELIVSSLNNIVICGGSSNFKGLPERFTSELENTITKSELAKKLRADKVTINIKKNRDECIQLGADILMSLSTFDKQMCVSKDEFDEYGETSIVARHFSF